MMSDFMFPIYIWQKTNFKKQTEGRQRIRARTEGTTEDRNREAVVGQDKTRERQS